jgi:hypothetical protein
MIFFLQGGIKIILNIESDPMTREISWIHAILTNNITYFIDILRDLFSVKRYLINHQFYVTRFTP